MSVVKEHDGNKMFSENVWCPSEVGARLMFDRTRQMCANLSGNQLNI